MAKDLDINLEIHDVDIKDSKLYRLWTRPNSPDSLDEEYLTSPAKIEVRKPTGPPPGLDKKPISPTPESEKKSPELKVVSGIVKYDGFCFHCNRHGHKPSQPNGCSLSPIEESEACRKAKRKVWESKKAGRASPTSVRRNSPLTIKRNSPPTVKHQKW